MRWLLGVLLVVVALAGSARADEPPTAKDHYERGSALFAIDHYDEAIAEFEQGFVLKPLPEFLFNIAQAHRKAGRPKPALDYFHRYLDLSPQAREREEVEKYIAELEAELKPPPLPPPPKPVPAPAPLVAPIARAPEKPPLYRRWWLWTAVGGGVAVLAVGLGVGLGVGHGKLAVGSDLGTYRPFGM